MSSRIDGHLHVAGTLSAATLDVPAGTLRDAGVHANADIAAEKLEHQHQPVYAQASGTTAFAETRVVHVVQGDAAELVAFEVGLAGLVISGDSTITVDLKKNGASVLSAAVVLDNGDALRTGVAGTVTMAAAVAGDVYEVVVTVSAGTGTLGKGLFALLKLREKADE